MEGEPFPPPAAVHLPARNPGDEGSRRTRGLATAAQMVGSSNFSLVMVMIVISETVVMRQRDRKHREMPRSRPCGGPFYATYQTRISEYEGRDGERAAGDAAKAAYAELYGRVERKLFAHVSAGRSPGSLKSVFLRRYGIPARMFNAVRVSLEGRMSSVRETMALRRGSLQRRVARAEREIAKAVSGGLWAQVHQKRRRLANLRNHLAGLEADIAEGGSGCASGRNGCGASSIIVEAERLRQP